jgi:hypothetical protein
MQTVEEEEEEGEEVVMSGGGGWVVCCGGSMDREGRLGDEGIIWSDPASSQYGWNGGGDDGRR